jgi:hypothetical protein
MSVLFEQLTEQSSVLLETLTVVRLLYMCFAFYAILSYSDVFIRFKDSLSQVNSSTTEI